MAAATWAVLPMEANIDAGIGPAECNEMTGQPEAGDGLAGLHDKRSALQTAKLGQHQLGRFRARQNGTRLGEKERPGLSEFDAAAHPVEKFDLMPSFKSRDRGTDRRLRQIECFRRTRNMLALGHRNENTKLFKCHGTS